MLFEQTDEAEERRTGADCASTDEDDPSGILEFETPGLDVLKDGSAIIRKSKGARPFGPRSQNKNVVVDAFVRGKNNRTTCRLSLFSPLDGSDKANLDGTVVVDKKIVIRDKDVILEVTLGGGSHADGGRKVKRKWTSSYEGEVRRVGFDLGGEDASNGCAGCTTTDDDDALAVSLGHCMKRNRREVKYKVMREGLRLYCRSENMLLS